MNNRNIFIPSVFTFLNFFWGFFSIVKTIEGELYTAAWFIILAVLCDGMDGKLARWTGNETSFGFELDSLADMVSSGLAPVVLAYRCGLSKIGFAGVVVCFIYLFSGGYRLARFNVIKAGDRSKGYTGLPIPIAGLAIASLWILKFTESHPVNYKGWAILILALSLLMMSKIPYDWPKLVFNNGTEKFIISIVILSFIVIMAIFPQWSLFPLFIIYILAGVVRWIVSLVRGNVSLSDFFLHSGR